MATETTIVREAPFLEDARKKLIASADALAGTAVTLPKSQLAGFSTTTKDAFDRATSGIGAFQPSLTAAEQQFGLSKAGLASAAGRFGTVPGDLASQRAALAAGAAPLTQQAEQLSRSEGILGALAERGPAGLQEARSAALLGGGDITGRIGAFQDPFQQQVIDAFNLEANRQSALQRQRAADAAVQQGAFGSSGAAIQQAELERNLADVTQRNTASLLSQGYGQALGAAEREAGRFGQLSGQLSGIEQLQYQLPQNVAAQMQAGAAQRGALAQQQRDQALGYGQLAAGTGALAGQEAAVAGAGQQLGGAYAGLAGLSQQLPAQDIALLSQIGSQQQQQAQRALDIERQNILQQTYEPYQRIGYLGDILKGQPSTQSTLTQSTDPRGNPLSQALGAGISLAGIFGPQGFGSGYLFKNPQLAGKV
jgi:hypothetical protein